MPETKIDGVRAQRACFLLGNGMCTESKPLIVPSASPFANWMAEEAEKINEVFIRRKAGPIFFIKAMHAPILRLLSQLSGRDVTWSCQGSRASGDPHSAFKALQ